VDKRRVGLLEVSIVGLGCNNFGVRLDLKQTTAVVHAALDAGITFFDTADVYGNGKSEEFIGRALAARRDQVVIATKFGIALDQQRKGAKPAYVKRACEDSLRRLKTDRIDLYYLHRPHAETPIADTLGALDELVRAGKVREIGCSYFTAAQLREARTAAGQGARFAAVQNEYSLVVREPEREVLAECERQELAFLPYYPLASGVLTGKYRLGRQAPAGTRLATDPDSSKRFLGPNAARAEALAAFAESRGHTLLELAFSWLLRHRVVASVFPGAMSPEQVRANAQAAGWHLTTDELARVDEIAPRATGGAP
jgi:aryl-alcohol dehydrogenase-like predicted oxidoreductase